MSRGLLVALMVSVALPAAASPGPLVWYEEPPVVASVELRLPRTADADVIATLIPIRAGQRLTRRAIRRSVRLLYETGQFRQVRAHVRMEGERAVLTFVLLPRPRLAEISFLGASSLSDDRLLRASGLKRDDEYLPERVEAGRQALVEAYERVGYRGARIEVEVREGDDGQVACLFQIAEGPRTRLVRAIFEGDLGLEEAELREALGLRRGAPLDMEEIDLALRRLRRRLRDRGHLRAEVGPVEVGPAPDAGPGWGLLTVPVRAGPVTRIRVHGASSFTDREIVELLELPEDEPPDAAVLQDAARRVERRYRLLGYASASVGVEERAYGPGRSELSVRIHEGKRLRVTRIQLDGVESMDPEPLVDRICESFAARLAREPQVVQQRVADHFGGQRDPRPPRPSAPQRRRPDPCTLWDVETYGRALREIADVYRANGFLSVVIEAPELVVDERERQGVVRISVTEGPQTRLAEIGVKGIEAVGEEKVRGLLELEVGEPLSYLGLEEARFRVSSYYARNGYPFASVRQEVAYDGTQTRARVVYHIDEGPQVTVGRIIVRGHRHTRASLVRSRLALRQGDVWDIDRVQRSQQALLGLGVYRSAVVRFLDPEEPAPVMDLVVVVSEKRPKSLEVGFGVSTEDGPRVFAEYADLAFSASSELEVRGKANYPIFPFGPGELFTPGPEWETHLGLRFPVLWGLRTDAVWERDNRPTYSLTRLAGAVGADTRWYDAWAPSLRAEVEFDDLRKGRLVDAENVILTQKDRERLLLEQGQTLLVSLRPGLTLDLRDDRFSPRSGVLVSAAVDWSHDLGIGVPIHFVKASASAAWYIPAATGVTLALSGRAGRVFPLSPDNNTIGPKRFFLGGSESMRGFPVDSVFPQDERADLRRQVTDCYAVLGVPGLCGEDALDVVRGKRPTSTGGEAFVLLKGEVRFPIAGALQGGIFLDVGNLWRDPTQMQLGRLRSAAGAGLRYDTPVGPLVLDLGVNLAPDPVLREDPLALHFAIGLF